MNAIATEATWPRDRLDADYTARAACSADAFAATIADYKRLSEAALTLPNPRRDLEFDAETGLRLDLFGTVPGELRPLVVFIHGGYWRALSKEHSAFAAPMLAAQGIALAAPDYRLAPAASLTEIVADTRAALAWLWHNAPDLGIDRARIVVTGSSAGGHLVGALMSPCWQAGLGLPDHAIRGALAISGLFELAPIAASHVQDWMHLTEAEIDASSPLRHLPDSPARVIVAQAETETAGFHRQSEAYAKALNAPLLTVPGRHHFDVILDLTQPGTALSKALLSLFVKD